jgi:hypothetical protein
MARHASMTRARAYGLPSHVSEASRFFGQTLEPCLFVLACPLSASIKPHQAWPGSATSKEAQTTYPVHRSARVRSWGDLSSRASALPATRTADPTTFATTRARGEFTSVGQAALAPSLTYYSMISDPTDELAREPRCRSSDQTVESRFRVAVLVVTKVDSAGHSYFSSSRRAFLPAPLSRSSSLGIAGDRYLTAADPLIPER